jgi:hypothetical protein
MNRSANVLSKEAEEELQVELQGSKQPVGV